MSVIEQPQKQYKNHVITKIQGFQNDLNLEMQFYESSSNRYALLISPATDRGSMKSTAISVLFKAFVDRGWNVMRFNYRGVGESTGRCSNYNDALMDTHYVLDWYIRHMNISKDKFVICGYEFGAKVALETLMRRPEINNFIVINPPAHESDFSFLAPCPHSGLIVSSATDKFTAVEKVREMHRRIAEQQPKTELELLETVDIDKDRDMLYSAIVKYISTIETDTLEQSIAFDIFDE